MSPPAPAPAPPPATPLELTFQPGRRDAIQGLVAGVPNWIAYVLGFSFVAAVTNLLAALLRPGAATLGVGVAASLLVAWLVAELAFRLASPAVRLGLDATGLRVFQHAYASSHAWAALRVRETASAYVFFTSWPLGVALPKRALTEPQRSIVEAWLAERGVKTRRKPLASLRGLMLTFVGILLFVTCYNLMQGSR